MNVKQKIKYAGFLIAFTGAAILGYLFNRGRVPGDNDSLNKLGDGIAAASDTNNQLGEVTKGIKQHNKRARTELRTAKEILRAAKARAEQ